MTMRMAAALVRRTAATRPVLGNINNMMSLRTLTSCSPLSLVSSSSFAAADAAPRSSSSIILASSSGRRRCRGLLFGTSSSPSTTPSATVQITSSRSFGSFSGNGFRTFKSFHDAEGRGVPSLSLFSSSWWWRGNAGPAAATTSTLSPSSGLLSSPISGGLSSYVTMLTRNKHTLKTNKSVSKRFRARGDGTLVRMKSGKSHNTGDKPRARKNRLGQSTTVTEPKVEKKIKRVMPL